MKTIQCLHPHPYNEFVATCRLWMDSGRMLCYLAIQTLSLVTENWHVVTKPLS